MRISIGGVNFEKEEVACFYNSMNPEFTKGSHDVIGLVVTKDGNGSFLQTVLPVPIDIDPIATSLGFYLHRRMATNPAYSRDDDLAIYVVNNLEFIQTTPGQKYRTRREMAADVIRNNIMGRGFDL